MVWILRTSLLLVVAVVATVAVTGCGGSRGSGLPPGETGTVKGKVVYNGIPVPDGWTIVFMHDETSQTASGTIKEEGAYELMMQFDTDVLAGDYRVCLTPPADDTDKDPEAAMQRVMAGNPNPRQHIPPKLQSFETSGITAKVEPGENVDLNFDIPRE